jgi:hypothetical protein
LEAGLLKENLIYARGVESINNSGETVHVIDNLKDGKIILR